MVYQILFQLRLIHGFTNDFHKLLSNIFPQKTIIDPGRMVVLTMDKEWSFIERL